MNSKNNIPARINEFGQYMQGARVMLLHIKDLLEAAKAPGDRPYVMAEIELGLSSVRNTERLLRRDRIAYRNPQYKGKRLIKIEAYFFDNDDGERHDG